MEWIPCTERLPEKNGRYLVTRKFSSLFNSLDDVFIVNYSELIGVCVDTKIWWIGTPGTPYFEELDDVVAWMPLPDPYKTDIRINVSKWEDKEPTEIVKEEQNMAQNIIGERIAGLLREQGKTQRELAEQVGTTEVSMSRYIKGDRVPKGPILVNIAKALHTTTDYLLGNEKVCKDCHYNDGGIHAECIICDKKKKWWISNPETPGFEELNDVVAWMPLPDPYMGNEKDSNDPELEYNYTQHLIARNANRWSKKQKLDLVNALFENDD